MFSWEHANGNTMQGRGYTRDISPAGVFVLTSDRLPADTTVKLEVTLPSPNQKPQRCFVADARTSGGVGYQPDERNVEQGRSRGALSLLDRGNTSGGTERAFARNDRDSAAPAKQMAGSDFGRSNKAFDVGRDRGERRGADAKLDSQRYSRCGGAQGNSSCRVLSLPTGVLS